MGRALAVGPVERRHGLCPGGEEERERGGSRYRQPEVAIVVVEDRSARPVTAALCLVRFDVADHPRPEELLRGRDIGAGLGCDGEGRAERLRLVVVRIERPELGDERAVSWSMRFQPAPVEGGRLRSVERASEVPVC